MFICDDGNQMVEQGIQGAIQYAELKGFGTVGASKFVKLTDELKVDTKDRVCAAIDAMIDEGNPPDLVLDYSYYGKNEGVIKDFSRKLGLPTVSATMGEPGDIREWHNLSPEEEKYLIQVRSPTDMFQFVARDLAAATKMPSAVILYDDTFGKTC